MRRLLNLLTDSVIALCIAVLASILGACSASMPPLPEKPTIPASLLLPCPKLLPLEGMTGLDLTRKLIEVGAAYYDCADSKQALIDATGPLIAPAKAP
jgi:hypothetical protein